MRCNDESDRGESMRGYSPCHEEGAALEDIKS